MNNNICADRISIGDRIITVAAIVSCEYNSHKRQLSVFLTDGSVVTIEDDLAESTWDYLRSRIYGCVEPLPIWKVAVTRSATIQTNE